MEETYAWNSDQVCQHLIENDLEDIQELFHDAQIDGRVFLLLTEPLLKQLGVDPEDKRRQVLNLVDQIKKSDIPSKVINDPIHGHIELHPLLMKVIDTPQFQRLRYLKQLGGGYYVFPGACHNRFEHCIGVSHLAGELTEAIRGRQPELLITDQDVLCVRIAGLCHDLGHGPFSHVFDGMFMSRVNPDKEWKHEDASVKMFDHLVESNSLMPEFKKYGLDERDLKFIKEQIDSRDSKKWREKDKSFLYEVVANKRNAIDVDKLDYFARDCYHLGISSNFDHRRFMKFARVLKVKGQMQICFRDKEAGNLYDMFYTRTSLHRRACKHKTTGVIEEMIAEALVEANDHLSIEGKDGKKVKLSDAVDDMVAYTKLTDHIFQEILYSKNRKLKKSQKILQKIQERQLYKCVGQTKPKRVQTKLSKSLMKRKVDIRQKIVTAVSKKKLPGKDWKPLKAEDVIIQLVNMDYGKKNKNPIDHVHFYTKYKPNEATKVRRDQLSHMLPKTFSEHYIRAFTKKTDKRSVRAAALCFDAWCKKNGYIPIETGLPKGDD